MSILKKHNIIAQSIWLPVSILGGFLLLSLIIELTLSFLSYHRIIPIDEHANHLNQIQIFLYKVETTLSQQLPKDERLSDDDRIELKQSLQSLLEKKNLDDSTPAAIRLGQLVLDNQNESPQKILLNVLFIMRKAFQHEANEHAILTKELHQSALLEIKIGITVLIVLPVTAFGILLLMRYRIYVPLQQMGLLMKSLGSKQYQTISAKTVDPIFQPLFENYNTMVQRLSQLEIEHLDHEQELQLQVEKAARTLIKQQQNLANSERLAALGEVMARISHELRNPLAGVQMACSNIKNDMVNKQEYEQYHERLTLMCSEIDRMIDLLNGFLLQAQHQPEAISEININTTIQDLLSLVRYQLPEQIKLKFQSTETIHCQLPDIEFRQAVLNLILNAQHAMGEQSGQILLEVTYESNVLIVNVIDEGPGFPSEMLNTNIRSFTSNRRGGTGLGLSMVNRFVHNHNGQLLLNNRTPLGACVTIKLPCV